LNHQETMAAVTAERALLHALDSGCQFPVGAHGTVKKGSLEMVGFVGREDGSKVLVEKIHDEVLRAADAGKRLAEKLIARGALNILNT
jgi:hydroxymethylbilane synthase